MKKTTMSQDQLEELLGRAEVGHLATLGPEGPYLVPLHFLYREGSVYFHCGLKGRKLENLRKDPRVCFQVEEMTAIIPHELPCRFNTRYASVLMEGRAEVLTNEEEKLFLLEELAGKYKKEAGAPLSPKDAVKTLVVKITPLWTSGKINT